MNYNQCFVDFGFYLYMYHKDKMIFGYVEHNACVLSIYWPVLVVKWFCMSLLVHSSPVMCILVIFIIKHMF